MEKYCSDLLSSPQAKCAYLAIVLVLVLLVFMHVLKVGWQYEKSKEHLKQAHTYYGGAANRPLVEDSATNRGEFTSGSVIEMRAAEWAAQLASGNAENVPVDAADEASENLTSTNEGADLWAVGHDLGAYKAAISGQTEGLKPGRRGMQMEKMTTEKMQDDVYEALLFQSVQAGA